ncbi:hypothetical protein KBA73_05610 [Patescibacteria group bacterium]|nr:hypothetical protein [Patescibacteria group bacterium]
MEKKRGRSLPPERSEEDLRQERREYALMERRHQMALLGMRFEELLFSEEQDERAWSYALRIFIASLDSSLAPIYEKIVERHQKKRQEAQRLSTWLKMKTGIENPTSTELGTCFFAQVAPREEQQGIVKVTLEQGYLSVWAESIEDFIRMTRMNDAIGIFDLVVLPKKGNVRLSAPITYIYGSYEIPAEQIGLHEKQHYINGCLLGTVNSLRSSPFSRINHITQARKADPVSRRAELSESIFRVVKDEVLCFTKEGDTAAAFIHALRTDYRKRILVRLPKEQQVQAEQYMAEAIELLETIPLWDMGPRGRELLVQLLYPIQFERVHDWVPLIKSYYEKRIKEIREQMSRVKRQLLSAMEESCYATNSAGLVEQENATLEEAKRVFQRFHKRILGVPYKEPHVWRPSEMLFLERSFTMAFLCSQEPEVFKEATQECLAALETLCAKRTTAQSLSKQARFTAPAGALEGSSVEPMTKWLACIDQDPLASIAVRSLCQTFTAKKPVALLPVQDISGERGMRHLKRVLSQATKTIYGERTTINYHLIRISKDKIELDLSFDYAQEGTQKTTTKNPLTLYVKDVL